MRGERDALLPRIGVHIGMRQVRGVPVSEAQFRRFLARHTLEDWLQTMGKLSRALDDVTPADGTLDSELAAYLGPLAARAVEAVRGGGRFVSQGAINTVAREALLWAPGGLPEGFTDQGRRELAWSLLGAVDLFEDQRPSLEDLSQAESDEIVASLLLRRIARPYGHLRNRVPRTHRLFVDLPSRHPAGYDFDARCRALAGVGIARYLAICFTIHSRFGTSDLKDPAMWILEYGYFDGSSSVSDEEFRGAIHTVSATPDELRLEYDGEVQAGLSGFDDHRPIVRRPICEIRPGSFVPVDFQALGERLLGDGVYWRLRPTADPDRSEYGAAVGKMLEEHLYEVIRDVHPPPDGAPDCLFREKRYRVEVRGDLTPVDGPDFVLFDDDAVMICEVGANQVNVRDTLHRGSISSLDADIEDVLIPRAKQLHRKIEDIRDGALSYERAILASTRIEPVVCFLDRFPMAPFVRQRIDAAIRASGYLNLPNVGRLSILGAEDLEVACGAVEKYGKSMTNLLSGHAADPRFSDWPLADYVRDQTGELPITALLSREFSRVSAAFIDEIRPDEA